jgi:hypothetical protein
VPLVEPEPGNTDPVPYLGEDGSVYLPLTGRYVIPCMNALLVSYGEREPRPKRKKRES